LPNIEIPTPIIAGTMDFQFPPEHQMEMAKALRNAIYKGIDKAGHNPLIEKPAQTLEFIREFVQ
jgi:pimeloyl-ACP methyl ester carboxylesterase